MIYRLSCEIHSQIFIGHEDLKTEFEGKNFILIPNEYGLLSRIQIATKIRNSENFLANMGPSTTRGPANFEINLTLDEKLNEEIIDLFQYIESSLGFSSSLKKICWENPEISLDYETEEERKNYNVLSLQNKRRYPETKHILSIQDFQSIITNKRKYEFLKLSQAFYREGQNEYSSFRYINAYYNFYFVLEDLYGNGKTKNRDIEGELKSDPVFKSIVSWMMKQLNGRHLKNIESFLREEGKTWDENGIIELVVRVRGNLHHFSSSSTKRKGTPLNHREFESMAFLSLGLASRSILQKIYERNKGD